MLVTAIMPTRGRPQFAAQAVELFCAQTWTKKELIILDDRDAPSVESFTRLIDQAAPSGADKIAYRRIPRLALGPKRNLACLHARGELICFWDDDDYSAPDRMTDQVLRLEARFDLAGYNSMVFVNEATRRAWLYSARHPIGSSLMFRRSWWECHPFADQGFDSEGRATHGEDVAFALAAERVTIAVPAGRMMFARNHPGCTDPGRRDGQIPGNNWQEVAWPDWIGADLVK